MKLRHLQQEVARGAEQAESGMFVHRSVTEIMADLKQERHDPPL